MTTHLSASLLDALCDPERFTRVAARHRRAFAWQPQGWIPLGIHVVDPRHWPDIAYRDWLDPEPFLEFQLKVLADTLTVGSDVMPAVGINHLGNAVIPTMFGARLIMPESGSTTLQDVGPEAYPVFDDIGRAAEAELPAMDAGLVPHVESFARLYRQHLPRWVRIVPPDGAGPFTTAMQLRGSGILIDMVDDPGRCRQFIGKCADVVVGVQQRLRRLAGLAEPDKHVTNFGIVGAGLRLGEDSLVCLSPDMIRQFCAPVFARVNRLSGGHGHVHFCSLPHSRYEHIYGVLAGMPGVTVVSSQFAFEYYAEHIEELRGRLAVESFYGSDARASVCARYGSFRDWANEFVPRFKDESGLVLYFQVASVEEGREVWDVWQSAHRRQ
jgi:hypothetical protein